MSTKRFVGYIAVIAGLFALLVALLVAPIAAMGAEPEQGHPCIPSETNIEHAEPLEAALTNGDDWWGAWRCAGDDLRIDTFDKLLTVGVVLRYKLGVINLEQLVAEVNAWPRAPQAEAARVRRMVLVNHYGAQPQVLSPIVYKRRIFRGAANGWIRVGRISAADLALGVNCDIGGRYNSYMRIDTVKVAFDSKTAAVPVEVFAQCG